MSRKANLASESVSRRSFITVQDLPMRANLTEYHPVRYFVLPFRKPEVYYRVRMSSSCVIS